MKLFLGFLGCLFFEVVRELSWVGGVRNIRETVDLIGVRLGIGRYIR